MSRVVDGHEIATIYTSADRVEATSTALGHPRWQIRQRHTVGQIAAPNDGVLADLHGGVEAIELTDCAADAVPELLEGVHLEIAPVSFSANADGDNAWALVNLWSAVGVADADAAGCFGVDPLAASGRLDPAGEAGLVSAATVSVQRFPRVRSVGVDASGYGEQGASPATELGLSMATATEYLRTLDGAGLAIDDSAAEVEFTYLATADQFITMAKLRAARRMWHRVVEVCGGSTDVALQHQRAITAAPIADDPWAHVLRSTTACFAAAAGGAQAITVVPFDATGTSYEQSVAARVARNTHHLLIHEAHVAEVTDPAAGSPYVETLTETFAREAWSIFKSIEAQGGLAAVAEAGGIADLVTP